MKSTKTSRSLKPSHILVGSIFALLAVQSAHAASQTWDGGSVVNGNWSTIDNWDGAVPGDTASTTNADVATFNAAIANTWGLVGTPIVIDSATQNIGGLSFDLAADNYFIGNTAGNSLLLSSGGTIQILNTLTATNAVETINAPLIIQGAGGTSTFANNSANGAGAGAGTLNIGGGITGAVAGATVLTLSGSNTNANLISGIIGNGSATTFGITKSGLGTWGLSGANTFSGQLTVQNGTLSIASINNASSNGTLGNSALAVILGNTGAQTGTLQYTGGNAASTKTFTMATGGTGAFDVTTGATNLTLSGVIGGSGALVKAGAGTLTLGGNNTFSGVLTVQNGTLAIATIDNASRNSTLGNSGNAVVLGSSGNTGTLQYTGVNRFSTKTFTMATGGTGAFDVTAGATNLLLFGAIGGSGAMVKTGAGILTLGGNNAFGGQLSVQNGTLSIDSINNVSSSGRLGNSANAVVLGSSGNTGVLRYTYFNTSSSKPFTMASSGTGAFDVVIPTANLTLTGLIDGGGAMTKMGLGTLTLNSAAVNTFTGGLNVNRGTLALDFTNASLPSTDLINSANALSFGGGFMTLKAKTSGITAQAFNGVTVNAGGGSLLVDTNAGTGTNLTLGSLGTLSSWVKGSSLVLGKANTNAGTLAITTTTDYDAQSIYGGRIVFANGTADTGYDWATRDSAASTPFTLAAFGTGGNFGTYTAMVVGATSDALNTRVTGAGITLTGAHTHNSLKLQGSFGTLALGTNLLTLTSGGLLVTGNSGTTISGTAGATRLTGGNNGGSNDDLIVHQYNSGGLTISAVIGDNGNATALTKAGTQTLTLTGNNTFTGGLNVNAGTLTIPINSPQSFTGGIALNAGNLRIGNASALGAVGNTLSINGGTLSANGSYFEGSQSNSLSPQNRVNNPITINGDFVFNPSQAALWLTGDVSLGSAPGAVRTITLTQGNTTPLILSGAIADGATGKALQFFTTNPDSTGGNVILMGNSTYSGGTSTPRIQDGFGVGIGHNNALGTGPLTLGYRTNIYAFAKSVTIPNDVYWNGNNNGSEGEVNFGIGIASANDLTVAGTSHFIGNDNRLFVMRNEGKTTLAGPVIYASNVRFEWDNDRKENLFITGNVTLTGADRTISVTPNNRSFTNMMVISGIVQEDVPGRALIKAGNHPLILSGLNTYTGRTEIAAGPLQATDGTGLPTNSLLYFNGGVLESKGSFQRTVANTAGNRVFWNGNGGFAAVDGKLTVTLNTTGSTVDWGSASGFNGKTLILSSKQADAVRYLSNANNEVEITNPISLVNAARTVQVDDNGYSRGDFATLSGIISSTGTSGGITKTGAGTLVLSNTGNSYTGPTIIWGGAVQVTANQTSLPAASNLQFNGALGEGSFVAVLETSGTFTRSIGTAAGNVQWLGAGGFAAKGAPLTVTLNNDAVTVIDWAGTTAGGGLNNQNLRFGSHTSDNVVTLVNHLNMNTSADRIITVNGDYGDRTVTNNGKFLESLAAGEYAEISGIISNSNGSAATARLVKAGAGTLYLSNTGNSYTGPTRIQGGALRVDPLADSVGTLLPTGLPALSNLQFNNNSTRSSGGGNPKNAVLETSGFFTRSIGTGAGQVQWQAAGTAAGVVVGDAGGFAAKGGALTVNIGGLVTPSTLLWAATAASGGLNNSRLVFGSMTADNVTILKNNLNLDNDDRTIHTVDNPHSTADYTQIDGTILPAVSGYVGGLTIEGYGLTVLTSFTNTNWYLFLNGGTGVTRVPTATSFGGRFGMDSQQVLETSGTYNRALGTGAGQISISGGGFSAFGAKLTVNLHNDQRELVWATGTTAGTLSYGNTNFYSDSQIMTFGSVYSNNEVEWQNPLALGVIHSDKVREIKVNDNPLSTADFTTMSGVIRDANATGTGTNNGIRKTGTGVLKLSAANLYTGTTLVDAGTLVAANATALGTIASGTTVATGATLDVRDNITTEAITVGGTGVSAAGALITATANTGTVGGTVTLTGATSIGGAGTGILNINGVVTTGGNPLTTLGTGETTFGAASTLTSVASLAVTDGTTNVNSPLGTAGNAVVAVSDTAGGVATKLRFGSVSQTLSSLTIGAGATVIFTSGAASGSLTGDDGGGKAAGFGSPASSFGGGATVPEPGTLGLLLVGGLGVLNRRRRQA